MPLSLGLLEREDQHAGCHLLYGIQVPLKMEWDCGWYRLAVGPPCGDSSGRESFGPPSSACSPWLGQDKDSSCLPPAWLKSPDEISHNRLSPRSKAHSPGTLWLCPLGKPRGTPSVPTMHTSRAESHGPLACAPRSGKEGDERDLKFGEDFSGAWVKAWPSRHPKFGSRRNKGSPSHQYHEDRLVAK